VDAAIMQRRADQKGNLRRVSKNLIRFALANLRDAIQSYRIDRAPRRCYCANCAIAFRPTRRVHVNSPWREFTSKALSTNHVGGG
jgi:hypothetical protein